MVDLSNSARVLFWGTTGPFALAVLECLLDADTPITGIVVPGADGSGWQKRPRPQPPAPEIPLHNPFVGRGLAELAWERDIPLFSAGTVEGRYNDALFESVSSLNPSVIVVACWHARLPVTLLTIPEWGGLNIHPSRLPAFRGPVPLFWQRRAGLEEGAVTVHGMSAEWDQGVVYAQAPVRLPDGATMDALDQLTGEAGGVLAVETLSALAAGTAQPVAQPKGGSYQSYPRREDFEVPVTWTVRHAWNFMRAAESFGTPFAVVSGNRTIVAHRAVAYHPGIHNSESPLETPNGLAIQFTDGVLVVT